MNLFLPPLLPTLNQSIIISLLNYNKDPSGFPPLSLPHLKLSSTLQPLLILHITPLLKILQKLSIFLRLKSKLLKIAFNIPVQFLLPLSDSSYKLIHGSVATGTCPFNGPYPGISSVDSKSSTARLTHSHLECSNTTILMRSTLTTLF